MNSIERVIRRLRTGSKDRARFVASHIDKGIAYQIRALRDRQKVSQEKLAELVGMNQNAISRLESPTRGRPTITTLKRLAEAFDVALVVRFEPFSQRARWASGMPSITPGLSTEALAIPNFQEEEASGIFDEQLMAVNTTTLDTLDVGVPSVTGALCIRVLGQSHSTWMSVRTELAALQLHNSIEFMQLPTGSSANLERWTIDARR